MTTLQNDDSHRKSSVYNQTGQSYFEQLSAYNRMSAHLRRILLAQSVVDSRNKKYMRDKRLSSRSSSCSKSLDKILERRDIIDEIAYDTENHPIDVLRMSLGCDPECRHNKKRIVERTCSSCNNDWCAQDRNVSPKTARRTKINSEIHRRSRTSNFVSLVKVNCRSSCESARSSGLTGRRSDRQSEVVRARRKINVNDESETRENRRSNRIPEVIDETYSYNSSFESSSDISDNDLPVVKKIDCSSARTSRVASVDRAGIELGRQLDKLSDTVERTEEAKYAKFLYDITQEIMLNGLYKDQELKGIFDKHVDINSEVLDRNKMLSEIHQLKMSLSVKDFSDDDEAVNDVERFTGSGRFGNISSKKSPAPAKIRDENKLKNHEEPWCFDESRRRSKNSHGGTNTVTLVDANPEMLITERDVLVTLTEMKLDPRQVQTICKSLLNKSRRATLSHTVQVQVDEVSYSRRQKERGNSPITGRSERTTNESFRSAKIRGIAPIGARRDDETTRTSDFPVRTTRAAGMENAKKARNYACQCKNENAVVGHSTKEKREAKLAIKSGASQTDDEKPEVAVQTSLIDRQTRGMSTTMSPDPMNGPTMRNGTNSSESGKSPEISRTLIKSNDESRMKNGASGESLWLQDSKTRQTSSPQREENEESEYTEYGDARTKKKKRSSTMNNSATTVGRSDENDSKPISKSKKETVETVEPDDKNDGIPETSGREKFTESKKSIDSTAREISTDQNDPDSIIGRESSDPDRSLKKSGNDSMMSGAAISEKSEATITDIATEQKSGVSQDDEKFHDITDDELASLYEDNSEIEQSQIVEELSSIMDTTEYDEKSENPIATPTLEKSKSILSENSEKNKLHIVDESEEEDISTTTKSDRNLPGASSSKNGSRKFEPSATVSGKFKQNSKYDEVMNEMKMKQLTDSSLSTSPNDDLKKTRSDDESSISEELEHHPTVQSENRLISAESNDNLDRTKKRSLALKKKKKLIDDTKAKVSNADENSEEEMRDKKSRQQQVPIDRTLNGESIINDISKDEQNSSFYRRTRNRKIGTVRSSTEKIRGSEGASNNRKKKKELICSPCLGRLIGKSNIQSDSTLSLEAPRTNVKKDIDRKRTTFREESLTTASDISLLNKEDFNNSSSWLSQQASLQAEEISNGAALKTEKEINPLPWMNVEKEMTSEEPQDKPVMSGPRRNTIHRRTSLIRSLRIAMENLKKRRNTNNVRTSNSQKFPIERESSSDTTILPESQEYLSEKDELNYISKNSPENSSYAEILPELKETAEESMPEGKASEITSNNASTSTTVDNRFNVENPSNSGARNKCRSDCRGFMSDLDQLHRHTAPSEKLDS